ncbi:hypothetical protein BDV93DRAFT_610899 [Ceratobasidium sp. AG-I]|nr:hypothetical protein BDV93DRAFT_610899 [Ceratobasidium sp. AG-I]
MNRSSLKGRDAYLVKHLRPLAQELRMKIGLASVNLQVDSPWPDEEGNYDVSWTDRGGPVDGFDVGYDAEITSREVTHLVDMDGNLVSESPTFSNDLEEEFMPDGWDKESTLVARSEPNRNTDFKEVVEDALKLCLRQKTSKFTYAMLTTTPDPGLEIEGLGPVEFPLSPEKAPNLIGVCNQAPFGKGDVTMVDKQVHFSSPEWDSFLERTTKTMSSALGVDLETVQPKAELHKLLVYGQGSHFLPHVDTEKSTGMFGTMIVILPSEFEGGAVYLSHLNQRKVFNVGGPKSACETSILAWYSDVVHEVKPVTSGYRFALAYNLVRSETSVAAHPIPTDAATVPLKKAFALWARALEKYYDAPSKLAWLLEHRYSHANLSLAALKGRDAHLAIRLRRLAKELRLELGLATVSLEVQTRYPDEDTRYAEENHSWNLMSEKDSHGGSVQLKLGEEFWPIYRAVEHLVDMDGELICEEPYFSHDLSEEVMPHGWDGYNLEQWTPDRQEYEGYTGNVSRSVCKSSYIGFHTFLGRVFGQNRRVSV